MKLSILKKTVFLFLTLLCYVPSQAGDWLIVIKPVNPFHFGSSQIFAPVTIINNSSLPGNARVKIEIRKADGFLLSEYNSYDFVVKTGATDLMAIAPSMQASVYYNDALKEYEKKNGSLPSGNYKYCVLVTDTKTSEVTSQCSDFTLENLNPANLVLPEHKSEIENNQMVQFTWTPCTPVKSSVFYSLKLVEMYPEQSANDAIIRNPAIHQVSGLGTPMYSYPASAVKLEKNKNYAWQIECYEDMSNPEFSALRNAAVSSEIHIFKIKGKDPKDTIVFATPVRVQNADYSVLNDGKFYFSFKSDYIQGMLDYHIQDPGKKPIKVSICRVDDQWNVSPSPIVLQGENKYVLEFKNGLPPAGIYTLVLKDLKGIEYYLKIQIN